jgi:sigma-B regulation protein RsbQ
LSTAVRNTVHMAGTGPRAMMFAHGFGYDQNKWRHVSLAFEEAEGVVSALRGFV